MLTGMAALPAVAVQHHHLGPSCSGTFVTTLCCMCKMTCRRCSQERLGADRAQVQQGAYVEGIGGDGEIDAAVNACAEADLCILFLGLSAIRDHRTTVVRPAFVAGVWLCAVVHVLCLLCSIMYVYDNAQLPPATQQTSVELHALLQVQGVLSHLVQLTVQGTMPGAAMPAIKYSESSIAA